MSQRRFAQRGPRRLSRARRGERGSALSIAIVVMLAMIVLGMLALRSTSQGIAGSGNLRMTKQARYIAEIGLYHAITLINQRQVDDLLMQRRPGWSLEIDSEGKVRLLDADGQMQAEVDRPTPKALRPGGQNALGQFGEASDLVPSYRVQVEGFQLGKAPAGADLSLKYCQLELNAQGYVAHEALPDTQNAASTYNSAQGRGQFAEAALRAGTVVGPDLPSCP